MTHDSYREWIQRELDDDLSAEELALLEAHVATCAECRQEREAYNRLAIGLSRLSKLMPERSFVPQIPPDILPQPQKSAARRISPIWWRGLSVAAVIVLAIGWATQWKYGQGSREAVNQPATPASKQTALLPSSPPEQGQSTPGSSTQTSPTTDSQVKTDARQSSTVKQAAPAVLQNVKTLLRQSLFPTPAPQTPKASSGTTKPSHPTLLADASNGLTSLPSQPSNTDLVPSGPVTKSNDNSGSGNSTSLIQGSIDDAGNSPNNGIAPTPTQAPSPAPTPVDKGTITPTTGGNGFKPSLAGGQSISFASIQIGPISNMSDTFTESLQKQADGGIDSAQWAIDPVQVVKRSLNTLGFNANAVVTPTNDLNRVRVFQGGVPYEITLEQPYEQGANGIWQPVQIGRAINTSSPFSYQKPILAYFNTLIATRMIRAHQQIFVVSDAVPGPIIVTVVEERVKRSGVAEWVNVKYAFQLKQNAQNAWVLNGTPYEM